jgi:transcriptional regulator with XRE-family HTH domain
MKVFETLRTLRKSHKISQNDLALTIGVSREYVGRVENGKTSPSVEVLNKWCEALGCKLSVILNEF